MLSETVSFGSSKKDRVQQKSLYSLRVSQVQLIKLLIRSVFWPVLEGSPMESSCRWFSNRVAFLYPPRKGLAIKSRYFNGWLASDNCVRKAFKRRDFTGCKHWMWCEVVEGDICCFSRLTAVGAWLTVE